VELVEVPIFPKSVVDADADPVDTVTVAYWIY
jgi:hypothetical protein